MILINSLLVFDRFEVTAFDIVPIWDWMASLHSELNAEHCQLKALNGKYWDWVTFTGPSIFVNGVVNGVNGFVDEDLSIAVCFALDIDRGTVHLSVRHTNWGKSAEEFSRYVTE